MPRMLELIRASALPSHQMMSASKGALRLPPEEMVEILVYLTEHNKIFGEQARLTLAGWDEASSKAIASDPNTPKEILDYWLSAKNLRPALFPFLLENSAVSVGKLSELAMTLKGEWVDAMLGSLRVRGSRQLLTDLSSNKDLSGTQSAQIQQLITGKAPVVEASTSVEQLVPDAQPDFDIVAASPTKEQETARPADTNTDPIPDAPSADAEADDALVAFFTEHASEIAADADKPFQPIGGIHEEIHAEPAAQAAAAAASASPTQPLAKPRQGVPKKLVNPADEQRGSVLQKIS